MPSHPLARGAALLVGSELCFSLMGAAIKAASPALSVEVLLFFRNAFAAAILLPWAARGGGLRLPGRALGYHLLRSVVGVAAMYCMFYTVAHLPLADAALLKTTTPLFIPLIAAVWLGERPSRGARWAVVIGFAGVALVLRPGAGAFTAVAAVGVAGGALAALAMVTIRRMSAEVRSREIALWFSVVATAATAARLPWVWVTPRGGEWVLLGVLGACGAAGQLLMTNAYASAPAGQVGPLTYSGVVFSAALGWALWGEAPGAATWAGAALIASAGVLVMATSGRAPRGAVSWSEASALGGPKSPEASRP